MKNSFIKISCIVFMAFSSKLIAQKYQPEWENLKKHQAVPEWFADAKLGIYFHWGIYSIPASGGEWYARWMYVPDRVGWEAKFIKITE